MLQLDSPKPFGLLFQALANPTRMKILYHLAESKGGRSVTQICQELALEQTLASHALRCLAFCGLVTSTRRGKSIIYAVNDETVLPLIEIAERHIKKYGSNLQSCAALER